MLRRCEAWVGGWVLTTLLCGTGCQKDAAPGGGAAAAKAALPAVAVGGAADDREVRLALLRSSEGRPVDTLITTLQDRATRFPQKIDGWILLGHAWIRKARETVEPGYYRNAEACAAVALRLEPGNTLALNLRGLVLLNDHQFQDALQLAQSILRRNDFDPLALGTLSDALLELGRVEAAEEAVGHMMALKPNMPSYARASYLQFLRGQSVAAKQAIRLAIDASPASRTDPEPRAWAITQAAQLFWHEGDYEGADAGYLLALKGHPDFPAALVGRGLVAMAQGRYRDAAGHFDVAQRRNPLPETAWLLGDARTLAGDLQGANEAYDQLLRQGRRTDPRTVALYLARSGRDLPEALALIEGERKGRNDLYTQDIYAYVLHRLGRQAEARTAIDAVLGVGIKDARILYHAAEIHAASGDAAGARTLVEDALRRNPRFDVGGAKGAQALLARLGGRAQATPASTENRLAAR